jgi:ribosome recycling factor
MSPLVTEHRLAFDKALEHLKLELQTIRSNRAHPSLVEDVKVAAYGSTSRLKELATITVPDPRTIQVQPWDKTILKDIERSLQEANLGLSVLNDGAVLRLTLPPLTSESRQALLKVLQQKLEAGRVQVRQIRERVREHIVKAERQKEIGEDDRYRAQEDLDEVAREYVEQVNALGSRKEEEITTV